MGKEDQDKVVVDAIDAVTSSRDVHWDRCASLVPPARRGEIENLRALSQAFAARAVSGRASAGVASTASNPYAGPFVRRLLGAIVAIAALEAAAMLLVLPWVWNEYYREHGDLAVFLTTLFAGHVTTACLLLLSGRRERRTRLLGAYFLLKAPFAGLHMIAASLWEIPPEVVEAFLLDPPAPARLLGYLCVHSFLFAPAFIWAFAGECPRVRRPLRLDGVLHRMGPVSVTIGGVTFAAGVVSGEFGDPRYAPVFVFATMIVTNLSALAAVAVVGLRALSAPVDEARRVLLFAGGFLVYLISTVAYDVPRAAPAGYWLANYEWTSSVWWIALTRFPGVLLLWYSVLAVRVPDLREVVRVFYRRLLLRRRLLAAAAASPSAALGWLVAIRPERTVGAVVTDPLVQVLFGMAAVMLLVVAVRERLLRRLDAWVYPETADQRGALAAATAALAQASQTRTIGSILTRTVNHGCGSPATLLVATDTEMAMGDFAAPYAAMASLSRATAIVHMLERGSGSLRVHPDDATSMFELLPQSDAAWVVEAEADAVVAVVGPGAQVIGVLVVGRRFDDRIVRPVDIPFLEALASAAGLALARLRSLSAPAAGSLDGTPARACPDCGTLAPGDQPRACACDSDYVDTQVPAVLAGKYQLTRRLGTGGTGEVYVARDVRLQRDVAVKTLFGESARRLMTLQPEAWAMATLAHPAAAQIYGIEFWRGRSFLVVEFLAGGTLADRLRQGPVPESRAIEVIATLADALAALHDAGYLHGDIKPSNIGFTSEGSPKLLDFGLSREADDVVLVGGTPLYSSPEVLSGRPSAQADDIWSLCVVLYEMVAGRHPFADTRVDEVAGRILSQRIDHHARPQAGEEQPSPALRFAASVLTARRSSRPATAHALTDALRRMVGPGE